MSDLHVQCGNEVSRGLITKEIRKRYKGLSLVRFACSMKVVVGLKAVFLSLMQEP